MKHWLLLSVVAALAADLSFAQETAYKALRAVGTERGEKALNQVVAISGQMGEPHPASWKIILDDPAARGGIRELEVIAGRVNAERAPVHSEPAPSRPIDPTKLNLDSDGAFRVAEQQARKNQVGFDSVNYRLEAEPGGGGPIWALELFDYERRPVGTVRVSADSGQLVSGMNWAPHTGTDYVRNDSRRRGNRSDEAFLDQDSAQPQGYGSAPAEPQQNYQPGPDDNPVPDRYEESGRSDDGSQSAEYHSERSVAGRANRFGSSVARFGRKVWHKTERAARKVGGWFQEKFTGQNTLEEPDYEEQSPPAPSSRDPYNQPVRPEPVEQ
jgi:hypothetical protein